MKILDGDNATESESYVKVSSMEYAAASSGLLIAVSRTWNSSIASFYLNDTLVYTYSNPNTSYGVYYSCVFNVTKGDTAKITFSNSAYNGTNYFHFYSY